MLNKNTKKSPEIKRELFNCTGEMGMDNFGCLNSSLILFCFYFVTNLRKKIYGVLTLTVKPSTPPYEPIRIQLDHPSLPPPLRAYVLYG